MENSNHCPKDPYISLKDATCIRQVVLKMTKTARVEGKKKKHFLKGAMSAISLNAESGSSKVRKIKASR